MNTIIWGSKGSRHKGDKWGQRGQNGQKYISKVAPPNDTPIYQMITLTSGQMDSYITHLFDIQSLHAYIQNLFWGSVFLDPFDPI